MKDNYKNSNTARWIRQLHSEGTILMRCEDAAFPWLLYENPRQIVATSDLQEVMPLLEQVEAAAKSGAEVCGFLAYEAAPAMDPAMNVWSASPVGSSIPLLWFGVYNQAEKLTSLPEIEAADCFVGPWKSNRSPEEYGQDFVKIKDCIAAGETYQINYTLRLDATFHGSAYALFHRLYQRQPTSYAAFLNTGSHAICSVSPELFFKQRDGSITSKPMKGTRPNLFSSMPFGSVLPHCGDNRPRSDGDLSHCGGGRPRCSADPSDGGRDDLSHGCDSHPHSGDNPPDRSDDLSHCGNENARLASQDELAASENARLASRDELAASEKDRAENTMIVDMIRNDLGRIARPGSVETPSLFDIEEHPTLWQMTSTVRCQSDASLPEILAATFPCASITGAPKIQSMKIIRDLEERPRGLYTGAIGRFTAEEARFSVAIRTAQVDLEQNRVEYGCGGGIVWDSHETSELAECYTKAEVITQETSTFELLETMLYRGSDYFLLAGHLDRLATSARFFAYPFDRQACERRLRELARELQGKRSRIRLLLASDGQLRLEAASCPREARRTWKLCLAREPVDSANPFLYHKTTRRDVYRYAIKQAADQVASQVSLTSSENENIASESENRNTFDDVLLFNEHDEITESTIANLLVRIDDRLYTPPIESGLLGGTFRQALITRGHIREKSLSIEDLATADELFLINSVRGILRATLDS